MIYEPENLELWTLPECYAGETWPDYYVFLGRHRDSDALARSNFECGLAAIGGADGDSVRVVREGHWAVGWVEWIAIHRDNAPALEKADDIAAALEDYPIVDENHFSELEWTEAEEWWHDMPIRDRAILCRDAGVSIFAARRPWIPDDDNGRIFEILRE